jgi:hypothetical protein
MARRASSAFSSNLVGAIADSLARKIGRDKVFYDIWYQAELARVDLDIYLLNIVMHESRLVVVCIGGETVSHRNKRHL